MPTTPVMRLASAAAAKLCSWRDRLRCVRVTDRELLWILLVVSFAVRMLAWGGVVANDVPLRGDERGYFRRATGFAAVIDSVTSAQPPDAAAWTQAYGEGRWTPLHSFLLSLGMSVFGDSAASARFIVVLLSAVTTPLVFVLARRLASRRVALITAGLHAGYPTFVAYGHYLWSETTLILFLVLALILALRARDALSETARIRSCALAGLATGLCFLVKPAAILTRARVEGARAAAAFVLVWLIPWGAWSVSASVAEGRFIATAANSGFAMYRGNNPWMPPGVGSYQSPGLQQRMDEAIAAHAATNEMSPDDAARQLAVTEISSHPGRFVGRVVRRFQEYWFPDHFAMVHLYRGYYPPVSPWWGACFGVFVVVCYLVLMALIGRGLLIPGVIPRDVKALWLALVLMMMLPTILMWGMSRYHVPSLVILLPFAALAIDRIRLRLPRNREITWIAGCAAFLLVCANGVPNLVRHHIQPSSYYSAALRPLDRIYGLDLHFVDQVAFRPRAGSTHQQMTFTLLNEGAVFAHTGQAVATWDASRDPPAAQAFVFCDSDSSPLQVKVTVDGDEQHSVIIEPLAANAWRRWQPAMADLDYRWDPTNAQVPEGVYFPSRPSDADARAIAASDR
jgi:4-amino-4-deoxy-L-arabinose transferase-like glycosyltransferase